MRFNVNLKDGDAANEQSENGALCSSAMLLTMNKILFKTNNLYVFRRFLMNIYDDLTRRDFFSRFRYPA